MNLNKLKNIGMDKNQLASFISTLVATLAGVLIAIWLTDSGIKIKEKEDTIKLLQTAKLILTNTSKYSEQLSKRIIAHEKDSINYSQKIIESTKEENPIPYPDLFETIISNELVSKNISEYSHPAIYIALINLRKLANHETIEHYLNSLEKMTVVLDLEIELLKGEINTTDIKTLSKQDKNLRILELKRD